MGLKTFLQPGIIYPEQSWSKGTLGSQGKDVPPSQGHAQSSISGQKTISRVRWLEIYSLYTGQKKNNRGESILSESYLLWWEKELQVCYESPGKRQIIVASANVI